MNKDFQLIILSMPKSPRLPLLKKRLKELKIKNYKIFRGNNGDTKEKKKIIFSYCNQNKIKRLIGRKMTFNEIGAEVTTIKTYKYIVKNKIKNAIIMHDDIYPSIFLKNWINKKIFFNGLKIIGFFSSPPGFLRKKPEKIFFNGKIKLHAAKTHIFISQCIQVTYDFCKFYLKVTKGKVCGQNDFSFNFKKKGIKIYQTIPYLVYPNDKGVSFLREERNKIENPIISINVKQKLNQHILLRKFLGFVRIVFYLSFTGLFFKKCSYDYYKEYFFDKSKISFFNLFFRKYINVNNCYGSTKSFPYDLRKFVKFWD